MDRGRHRAILSLAAAIGGVALWTLTDSLRAQAPSPVAPATATPWVQASLPPTPAPPKPVSVVIHVDKESRYSLDKEKELLSVDALAERLRKLHETHGDNLRVAVRAEQDANYGAVTAALERVRDAGLTHVTFNMSADPKASASTPTPVPSASPSREEIAQAMARKREEELGKPSPASTPVKPPRAEPKLSPDERAAYERNLGLWLALPPEERQALRGQATERIREETEKAYVSSGLTLNNDQREVFALRYRQERRRLEREIQEKAAAERARRLPEIMDQLKHEFPATASAVSTPKPIPIPAPTAALAASPSPAK